MDNNEISFENLPKAVAHLVNEVAEIKAVDIDDDLAFLFVLQDDRHGFIFEPSQRDRKSVV